VAVSQLEGAPINSRTKLSASQSQNIIFDMCPEMLSQNARHA